MNPAVALLAAPLVIVSAITIGAGGAVTTSSPPVVSACSYTTPDAGRIAATFEVLTTGPVDEPHWDRYAPPVGLTIAWSASTLEQRHQVLVDTVTTILATTVPNAITTPVIIWWHGTLPASNDDVGWQTDTIPGWTGTLASYLTAFIDTYTSNPAVQAVARPTPGCSTCSPSGDLAAILATIRHRESNDNYTEHSRARSAGYAATYSWPAWTRGRRGLESAR